MYQLLIHIHTNWIDHHLYAYISKWLTSTHSVDPIKPNSSASQLQNLIVLRGLQPYS